MHNQVMDDISALLVEREMSEAPDNLVLVYLRRLDEKIDRLTSVVNDLGQPLQTPMLVWQNQRFSLEPIAAGASTVRIAAPPAARAS